MRKHRDFDGKSVEFIEVEAADSVIRYSGDQCRFGGEFWTPSLSSRLEETPFWSLMFSTGQYLVIGLLFYWAMSLLFRAKGVSNQIQEDEGVARSHVLCGLSWQELDLYLGEHFRRNGFRIVRLVDRVSGDDIDFVLLKETTTLLVHCKCWQDFQVGDRYVDELHELVKSRRATGGVLVTSGIFSKDAVARAEQLGISLINGFDLYDIIKNVRHSIKRNTRQLIGSATAIPDCPRCGKRMVLRVGRSSKDDGRLFWGCVNQPVCMEIRNF